MDLDSVLGEESVLTSWAILSQLQAENRKNTSFKYRKSEISLGFIIIFTLNTALKYCMDTFLILRDYWMAFIMGI